MLIQFLLIAIVLAVTFFALRSLSGEKSLALKRGFSALFALAAIIAVLFPQLLSRTAKFLGVGRGTDLLLYATIMSGLVFAVMVMRAKARSDARVTELARAVALMEARADESDSQSGTPQ